MQRLSIDSSASKLHSYGGRKDDTYDHDDLKHKESLSSPPLSPHRPLQITTMTSSRTLSRDGYRCNRRRIRTERSLFTSSPSSLLSVSSSSTSLLTLRRSQVHLAQFNGFMRRSKHLESDEDGEISRLMINADALAIRSSIRNLKETSESLPRRRTSHRKIADF
ncbi:hypothetical protein HID58_017582 [Brassica napus]|uniref:Uncharacterized protein n=1 Tax=Brassica napus TaxID=3708 RepID=A0ABQ8DAB4_BRANA|nr:hypothetical protein HID58_017582 [Brassica napus]